jgi:hypothetical protein
MVVRLPSKQELESVRSRHTAQLNLNTMDRLNTLLNSLPPTSETGRFMVTTRSGRRFLVEPLGMTKTGFGDINPATKKVEGSYGDKHRGSIDKEDSVITRDNGFRNITTLNAGTSPMGYIDMLDSSGIERIEELEYED